MRQAPLIFKSTIKRRQIRRIRVIRFNSNFGSRPSQTKDLGANLKTINWGSILDKFDKIERDVYHENDKVRDMDIKGVAKWRKDNEIDTKGVDVPNPILDFEDSPFPKKLIAYLKSKYDQPFPIQAQTWPVALKGRDMVGSAETGSGKTIAFLLPLLEHIMKQKGFTPRRQKSPLGLVIAPTRELVKQIYTEALEYAPFFNINVAFCHGGQGNKLEQSRLLSSGPHLIITTPGRLIDFAEGGRVNLESVSSLVLDEADRMFDMGFEEQVRMILSQVRPDRQVLMFSATWPKKIEALVREFFRNYVHVNIGPEELSANSNVEQRFLFLNEFQKIESLIETIKHKMDKKILIFCQTKFQCSDIHNVLRDAGIKCVEVHGDIAQNQRERSLDTYKRGRINVLIATDVASRGLDIKDITTVINFDFPKNIEDYIHRIGRTGRAGNKGESISFFTRSDIPLAESLVSVLNLSDQVVPDELLEMIRKSKMARGSNNNRSSSGGYRNRSDSRDRGGNRNFSDRRYNRDSRDSRGGNRDFSDRRFNRDREEGSDRRSIGGNRRLSSIFEEDDADIPVERSRNIKD